MARKKNSNVSKILGFLEEAFEYFPAPFETPYGYIRRTSRIPYKRYYDTVHQMKKRSVVKIYEKNGKKFIKLTKKGQLEALLYRMRVKKTERWDGKWRVIIFDIPEKATAQRNLLRRLLKREGYKKLQNSVFISPNKLNRDIIKYLKETKLIGFIRILRVDELDDDRELKRLFKL